MTPKEKADELFNHYYNLILSIGGELGQEILVTILAKQSALLAVDEIIKAREVVPEGLIFDRAYWLDVKYEIESK